MEKVQFYRELMCATPHLYRYAYSLCHNREDAEDLVQDCIVRAIAKTDQYEAGTHLKRWLFTILRNINIDRIRQQIRRGSHLPIEEWQVETHQPAAQQHRMALVEVESRFAKLRQCDQEIVRLSAFSGMRQEDIASHMGVAVGTVKSRLSRARKTLGG